MKKILALLLTLVLCASMFAGCSGTSTAADTQSDRVLHVGVAADTANFYPYVMTATSSLGFVYSLIYDNLVTVTGDGNVEMRVAESYEYSEDGTQLIFHLRQGVKFHNGDEVKASDVVFSYQHYCEEFYNGPFNGVSGCHADDDYTVVFDLDYIYSDTVPYGVENMAIISEDYYNEVGGAEGYEAAPIGCGPYKFVSYEPDTNSVYEAFDDYYLNKPSIKTIELDVIVDETAMSNALESGDIDMAQISEESIEVLEATGKYNFKSQETVNCPGILMNLTDEHWSNPLVREAMAYALDRDQMAAVVSPSGTVTGTSIWVPSVMQGYSEDVTTYSYDLEKAKSLMAEAGYPDGFDGGTIICNPAAATGAQLVQSQLAKIGITLEIQQMDTSTYYGTLFTMGYSIAFTNFGANSLAELAGIFGTGGNMIWSGYSNSEFDELIAAYTQETDADKANEIARQASEILQEDLPWIKCYNYVESIAVSKDLDNFVYCDLGIACYDRLSWVK